MEQKEINAFYLYLFIFEIEMVLYSVTALICVLPTVAVVLFVCREVRQARGA